MDYKEKADKLRKKIEDHPLTEAPWVRTKRKAEELKAEIQWKRQKDSDKHYFNRLIEH